MSCTLINTSPHSLVLHIRGSNSAVYVMPKGKLVLADDLVSAEMLSAEKRGALSLAYGSLEVAEEVIPQHENVVPFEPPIDIPHIISFEKEQEPAETDTPIIETESQEDAGEVGPPVAEPANYPISNFRNKKRRN